MRIEYDGHGLLLDGERTLLRSADLEYFRLPSTQAWRDRIERIAAAGFNCVSVAYPWSYHADAPGLYDWSGIRDVDALHDMIQDAGLYLIARPGPWIGADLDSGGLPTWLWRRAGVRPRCRSGGELHYSVEFIDQVEAWLDQVVPRFARRSNLVLVEVEHQIGLPAPLPVLRSDLGALGARWLGIERLLRLTAWLRDDPFIASPARDVAAGGQRSTYMRALCDLLRERGVAVPLTHADLSRAVRQLDVDLPALERRPLVAGAPEVELERELRALRGDARAGLDGRPLVYLGLDAGRSDGWGGKGYAHLADAEHESPIEARMAMALAEGASVINVRRFCGGISWGYLATPALYTSYDCVAPLSVAGVPRASYEAIRRLHEWIDGQLEELLESELSEHRSQGRVDLTMRRSSRGQIRFVQSLSKRADDLPYAGEPRLDLGPFETQIRSYDAEGRLQRVSEPFRGTRARLEPEPRPALPRLEGWTFTSSSPQLETAFDDESWTEITPAQLERRAIDMDALGVHHGFIWYRGTFTGSLDRLVLRARHCYSVWLNRRLIASGDPGALHSLIAWRPREVVVPIPSDACNSGRNALVILVESLGHLDGVLGAEPAPPGLLHVDTGATRVRWRHRGGLVRGERGIAPVVAFEAVERGPETEVVLPHAWPAEAEGVGLYETCFRLEGLDPKRVTLALRFDPGRGKANVYVNGYLLGRYWPERGPQEEFVVPWGVISPDQECHVAVALWKRADRAALGRLRLVVAA